MPIKNNDITTAVDRTTDSAAAAGQLIADRAEDVGQTVADTGRAVAAKAASVTSDARAEAAAAADTALDAAGALKDRTATTVKNLVEKMPQTPQQWQAAGQQLADRVRSNPRPWLIGAGVAVAAWWLGRRSAR